MLNVEMYSQQLQKLLMDKNQEKRTQALKEVESTIMIAIKNENDRSVRQIMDFFKPWIQSQNFAQKRAGMAVFQSIAHVAVRGEGGEKVALKFVVEITQPVLEQMDNTDEKVRLHAIESLYQLSKILKEILLVNFTNIFESMLLRASDHDEHVRKALVALDNVLKGIVTDCQANPKYFNIEKFIPILHQRMKVKQTHQRSMLINWIKTLHQIGTIYMFMYLPSLLEGLFIMLGDSAKDIRSSTDHLISDFFKEIETFARRPTLTEHELKITEQIITILIGICFKGNNFAKLSAVLWIFEYLRIFQSQIDDDGSSNPAKLFQTVVAAELIISGKSSLVRETDPPLKKTIIPKIPFILEPILQLLSHEEEEIRRAAQKTNDLLLKIMDKVKTSSIEFMNVVPIVKDMLTQKSSTAESALVWMNHLLRIYSEKLMPQIDNILSRLIEKLNDAEGTVLQNVMEVLGSISLHEQYFDLVIDKILNVFSSNREILVKRSDHIIKKLCSLLDPEKVYAALCAKLATADFDMDFISQVVQTMDYILVTDRDLQDLRTLLRNIRYDETKIQENLHVFETLFMTFSFNPVSTITLCFLAEEYSLAYNIIISFAEVEIDTDTLIAIAKLVNMLESAIFVYLRLQLLEHERHPFLLKSLQGLMMLLPQGVAFTKLKQRLKNVKQAEEICNDVVERQVVVQIDQKRLLNNFRKTRQRVYEFKREQENKDIYQL